MHISRGIQSSAGFGRFPFRRAAEYSVAVIAALSLTVSAGSTAYGGAADDAQVVAGEVTGADVVEKATATADLIEGAGGASAAAVVEVSPDGSTSASTAGGAMIEVPADPTQDVTLATPTGETIEVGVPGATEAEHAVVVGDTTIYADVAPESSIGVRPTESGVQALITIDGAAAPTTFDFPVTVPVGGRIALGVDGGAVVVDSSGAAVATVAPPWARDAAGASVPTHFELRGTALRQVVDHTAATTAYPVVADPAWFVVIGARIIVNIVVSAAVRWWYERNGYSCTQYGPWWWHMLTCAKPVS